MLRLIVDITNITKEVNQEVAQVRFFLELEIQGMITDRQQETNNSSSLRETKVIIIMREELLLIYRVRINKEEDNLRIMPILHNIEKFQTLMLVVMEENLAVT